MTAEITIMNKDAIALAADSAVTVTKRKGQRIYNTVNKLFTLSKYYPVGVMVYGNASFMGVPIETLIKVYRKKLANTELNTIREYAESFIAFIEGDKGIFNQELQKKCFNFKIENFLEDIKSRINKAIFDDAIRSVGNKRIKRLNPAEIATNIIEEEFKNKESLERVQNLREVNFEELREKYKLEIKQKIDLILKDFKILEGSVEKLVSLIIFSFLKDDFSDYTGIVIAGFGKNEIYPSYIELKIDFILDDKLKYKENDYSSVQEHGSVISFFAQAHIGRGFLRGVDSSLWNFSRKEILTCLIDMRDKIITDIMKVKRIKKKKEFSDKIDVIIRENYGQMLSIIDSYIDNNTVSDIVETTKSLPKDELAAMAETLVNLTSFKQRVSGQDETVGGPIDVAVISKGDGFIWIKRKHYFDPQYNPYFIKNYFRGESNAN